MAFKLGACLFAAIFAFNAALPSVVCLCALKAAWSNGAQTALEAPASEPCQACTRSSVPCTVGTSLPSTAPCHTDTCMLVQHERIQPGASSFRTTNTSWLALPPEPVASRSVLALGTDRLDPARCPQPPPPTRLYARLGVFLL
jgi:hypothetical protein